MFASDARASASGPLAPPLLATSPSPPGRGLLATSLASSPPRRPSPRPHLLAGLLATSPAVPARSAPRRPPRQLASLLATSPVVCPSPRPCWPPHALALTASPSIPATSPASSRMEVAATAVTNLERCPPSRTCGFLLASSSCPVT